MIIFARVFFCDGTRRYSVPGNENEECTILHVSIVISYNNIMTYRDLKNSRTFSRETVRMYKNPGDQNIFPKN